MSITSKPVHVKRDKGVGWWWMDRVFEEGCEKVNKMKAATGMQIRPRIHIRSGPICHL
jgi:hypothetical protein